MAGKRFTITRDDGELGTIDESELERAQASGFRVVDESEAKAVEKRRSAQSTGGMALGTGEALLRGASMGLSDPVARALGADMEAARLRQENLGTFGSGAEFAGALAPGLLTGGTGTLASVARATPAGLAARAGLATERAVLGSGLRSRVLGTAAQGGVEGFLGGVGQAASEAALGDRDLAAEKLMAGGLGGLGTGALVGGGFGLAGAGLGAAAGATERLARPLVDRAAAGARGLGERAARSLGNLAENASDLTPHEATFANAGRWLAKIQGRDPETYARLYGSIATKEGRGRILADMDEVRETTARGVKGAADSMNTAYDEAIKSSAGAAKRSRVAKLLEPIDQPGRRAAGGRFARRPKSFAKEHLDAHSDRLRTELEDELLSAKTRADLNEAMRLNVLARQNIREAKSAADAYSIVDDYKRSIDSLASRRFDQYKANKSPEALKAFERVRSLADDSRSHLENGDLYGDAALLQREMNAASAASMAADEALPPHLRDFLAPGSEASTQTALQLARESTRYGGQTKQGLFQKSIDAKLERLRMTRKHYGEDMTPEQLQKLDAAERSIAEMRAKLDELGETASVADDLAKARRDEGGGSPSLTLLSTIGPTAGAGLGFLAGGIPGAVLGSVVGMAFRPFTLARAAAAGINMLGNVNLSKYKGTIENVTSRMASVASGFDKLAEGGRTAVRTSARAARRSAAQVAQRSQTQESRAQRQARILATRATVLAAAADPFEVATQLEEQVRDLYDLAPNVARGIVERSAVAVQFLASKAPDVYEPAFGNGGPIVAPEELDRFERYINAVSDPIGAAEKVLSGGLALEHAETLRVVYPKIFGELQSATLEMLGRRKREGRRISEEALVELGLLLDMPLTDSLKPGFLGALQTPPPETPPALPAPGKAKGPKPIEVGGVQTELGRLEAGQLRA